MKTILALLVFVVIALGGSLALAQEGILPGEPDPNTSPKKDQAGPDSRDPHDGVLVDDRAACPKGKKRYQRMKCGDLKNAPECQNYSPVMDCLKKPARINCKKPQVPVPVYRCE